MQQATMIFNRQVLRLCKGILKAWEQWVEEMELENPDSSTNIKSQKSISDE